MATCDSSRSSATPQRSTVKSVLSFRVASIGLARSRITRNAWKYMRTFRSFCCCETINQSRTLCKFFAWAQNFENYKVTEIVSTSFRKPLSDSANKNIGITSRVRSVSNDSLHQPHPNDRIKAVFDRAKVYDWLRCLWRGSFCNELKYTVNLNVYPKAFLRLSYSGNCLYSTT